MHAWTVPPPDPQMTPVRARRGRVTHATSLLTPRRTACNRPCDGWRIATRERVSCTRCKLNMFGKPRLRRGARLA